MTDSAQAERMPATVREWTDILARIRFGKVKVAGKTLSGATIKGVAARLASYADGNGTRVRPGVARLAVDLEMDYQTARRAVSLLRGLGLIDLVRSGGRRGADEFRLTLPVDLLDRDDLVVWSPIEQRAEIDRAQQAYRKPSDAPRGGPGGGQSLVPEGPHKGAASLVPQGPVQEVPPDPITGPSGTGYSPLTGPSGTASLVPQGRTTHQDLDTTTTHHPDQDLRTDVTGPREPEADTNPDPPLRPKKCPDGLSAATRPDGKPECPICRRRASRPAIAVPEPSDEHMATVIQLRTREVS
jgi:hypothetical protein